MVGLARYVALVLLEMKEEIWTNIFQGEST
jgi:hypothetical protein